MSNKAGKRGLVPKLRFPEFREAGEWEKSPLSKYVSSLDAGVSVVSGDRPAGSNEVGILKTSAVTDGVFNPQENKIVLDKGELQRVKEPVSENSIIISRMNTPALVGANAYVADSLENIFLPDRLWAAKPRRNTSMRFIAFVLGSEKGRTALSELATGTSGSMKNITKPAVLALEITAPSFAEQQKIADCLSSLDELITLEAQKLDTLRTHKKGLMQQLFPAEGETLPKLRFPEFRDAGEWSAIQLGSICQPQQWATISSSDLVEAGYPVYGANGFIGYYTDFNHELETVAVTCRGSTCGEVSLIPPESYITGNSMCLDGINAAKNSYHFVYQLLKHRGFRDVISGSAQPQIVGSGIKRMVIAVPRQEEQQIIADCLASLDDLIAAQTQKLAALKTHKKGLMQQIFPTLDEAPA